MFYRVALSHSSSADSISDVHGPGTDDTHNVSQWREVLPGEEVPFEFEAREKLRHRYTSDSQYILLTKHELFYQTVDWFGHSTQNNCLDRLSEMLL